MVVIGAGRVGTALQLAAQEHGEPCTLITRTEGWGTLAGPPGEPIFLAVRADDLETVIGRVPPTRRDDLVFVQNGMYSHVLKAHRLTTATRGLLYFAVPSRGERAQTGEAPSPFAGPLALPVVQWLVRVGVPATVVDWPRFTAMQLEKLIWNCAFGALCQAHNATVGEVCSQHRDELEAVVAELRAVGRAALNVDLPQEWLVDRLVEYSLSIPDYCGAVKAWSWRDGWFVREAHHRGIATPAHHRLLRDAGFGDRLP